MCSKLTKYKAKYSKSITVPYMEPGKNLSKLYYLEFYVVVMIMGLNKS